MMYVYCLVERKMDSDWWECWAIQSKRVFSDSLRLFRLYQNVNYLHIIQIDDIDQ